jgi:Asp-tRNA(Asn)/Glu-tRNA(Gln) amidotransferase A subunit family amidase
MLHKTPGDLTSISAIQAVRLIHDGKLRPEALMEAYLDHIADRDSSVRAFAHFDPAQVRDATASVQTGPLRGIPIGVKYVLDTADMPSQYGSASGRAGGPKPTLPPLPEPAKQAPSSRARP